MGLFTLGQARLELIGLRPLLDELIVTVVPVVLGQGKPLFDRPVPGGRYA